MKKYIAYYRVSTNKQNLGLEAQRTLVKNYITTNGGSLISEYSEKESGKINNRIELSNAIKECQNQKATLIIAKLDRLSRNVSFVFALKDAGIDFISCDLPTFNTLTLAVFCGLAQQERELISQRTKHALNELKKQGRKLGNPNAMFTNENREHASLINKSLADNNENNKKGWLVVEALLKTTNNKSYIARVLNENGFRTSKGKLFSSVQVQRLIERYSTH